LRRDNETAHRAAVISDDCLIIKVIFAWMLSNRMPPEIHGLQEQEMTPEEIVTDLNTRNREALYGHTDYHNLTHEQVLALMDAAAMQGFRLGSNVALSMVKGALLVQLTRATGAHKGTSV